MSKFDRDLAKAFTPFDISSLITIGAASGTWAPGFDFAYAIKVGKMLWLNFRTGSATPSANAAYLTITLPYTCHNNPSGGAHVGSALVIVGATVENDGELFAQDGSAIVRIYRSGRAAYSNASSTTVQGEAWIYLE